jgi:hypothetical protein
MTDELDDMIAVDASKPAAEDKLADVRELAREAQWLELDIAAAEAHLGLLKMARDRLVEVDLPELMDAAGIKSITVEANGNMPAFTCAVRTVYRCNVGVTWPPDRRRAAFDWLEAHGHGSLIKTEVAVPFSRDDRPKVREFIEGLSASGVNYSIKENVHPSTMTAWLREMVERRNEVPPLDTVGGYIGREAVIKTEQS